MGQYPVTLKRGPLADFLREVREGFDHFDGTVDWQDWLDNARTNIVAMTVVFCFVVITGSCVSVPVIGLARSGSEAAATTHADASPEGPTRNPWSRDDPGRQPH